MRNDFSLPPSLPTRDDTASNRLVVGEAESISNDEGAVDDCELKQRIRAYEKGTLDHTDNTSL